MAEILQIGDVVRLKSGGPKMTVQNPGQYTGITKGAHCVWFDGAEKKDGMFPVEGLAKATSVESRKGQKC